MDEIELERLYDRCAVGLFQYSLSFTRGDIAVRPEREPYLATRLSPLLILASYTSEIESYD